MPSQIVGDISFYALVHHVLETNRESEEQIERRTHGRRQFTYFQWVAPYSNGVLPTAEEFTRVLCIDLSSSGFSYAVDHETTHEFVVVALGAAPHIFVTAEVVRRVWAEVHGEPKLLLGCRFVAKVNDPSYRPNLQRTSSNL